MKKIIVPIAVIVGIIAFFATIIVLNDFNGFNDDQNDPSESPVFSGRHNTISSSRTRIRTQKNTAESKPAEKKQPASNEKSYIDAIKDKVKRVASKNMKGFSKLYENSSFDSKTFEATIRATSAIPDPETNDYDNCLCAVFVEIDSLFSEVSPDKQIASEVIITVPIMKDKIILEDNIFQPGDKVRVTCAEYDEMPQGIQEIQISDDIQSYDHQQFYPLEIRKISEFQKGGNRNFAQREITILPIQNLPTDGKAVRMRKERIHQEIVRIEEEIKKHGGSFDAWKEEYNPIAEKYRLMSSEGWKGWINNSYFAAGESESTYTTAEFIGAILPYKEYLEKNNIDLVIVRVPSKADFAARVLGNDSFQENPAWVEHYYECLKNDIEIIDPMPEMYEQRFDYPLFYFYHIQNEIHPFFGYSFVTSKKIADVLKRYSYKEADSPLSLQQTSLPLQAPRYVYPEGNSKYNSLEPMSFYRVDQNGKTIGNLNSSTGSPFLFLSNSLFWHPNRGSGASVPGYTSYYLQTIADWSYQEGIDISMLRNLISRPILLSNRKAVVLGVRWDNWKEFPALPKYLLDQDVKTISLEKVFENESITKLLAAGSPCTISNDNGAVAIEATEPNPTLSFFMNIPALEGKSTCMLRLVFDKSTYATISVKDPMSKTVIDLNRISKEDNLSVDFFIPLSQIEKQIQLDIKIVNPSHPSMTLSRIELWYY